MEQQLKKRNRQPADANINKQSQGEKRQVCKPEPGATGYIEELY